MKDIKKSVEDKFTEMIMERSGEERIKMGLEMFELARKAIIASVRYKNKNISEQELKIEILKRCYGDIIDSDVIQDFSEKIKFFINTRSV